MSSITERESSPMRSLERALHLLFILERAGAPLTMTDLGRESKLSKATVLRILSVLERYGLTEKKQGRYRLGAAVLPLAHAYVLGNDLTRASLPVLQELAQSSEETASLFIRLGFKRVLVQRIEGLRPLRFALPIGQRLPLHLGAGKVLAAAMSKEEILEMLEELGPMLRASGDEISKEELLAELELVRRQGYWISYGEQMLGTVAVAAPVTDDSGHTIAAVSVTGATERMTAAKTARLAVEVRGAAKAIAERCDRGHRER